MLEDIKSLQGDLNDLKKEIRAQSTERISKKSLRDQAEELGSRWFSDFSEQLVDVDAISKDVLNDYSQQFGRLIKISAPNNPKKSYVDTLVAVTKHFREDLVLPIQTAPTKSTKATLLGKLLDDVTDQAVSEYLAEASACAKNSHYRAAAVLGWCVAIDRIHRVIEKNGFQSFNMASTRMAGEQRGRYKRFNSPQNVNSIAELREVFDTVILWVLEGMGMIDTNQHTRLRSCFDLRCQCAHPGEAPVTEYNLLSFYSDINEIVLKNPKFALPST